MQAYRTGTPASLSAGNDLASGESLEAFGAASTATSDLAGKVAARGMQTAASAATSAGTGTRTMILAGVVALLLSVLIAWIGHRGTDRHHRGDGHPGGR